ncbi:MAG TPA: T9SS type A sorting domain-containing protein [bacterium]|jgi:hypothetical protein|nr:T9SS type A sorting domain-containing protein [bacterium]
MIQRQSIYNLILILFFWMNSASVEAQVCCTTSSSWTTTPLVSAPMQEIAIGPLGNIYAPDRFNNDIVVFTNTGANASASAGPIPLGVSVEPYALALDNSNNLAYVSDLTTDSEVFKVSLISPFTVASSPWPINVAGGSVTVQALCVDSSGNLYATSNSSTASIYEYSSAGALISTATQDATGPGVQVPTGLCTNSAGTTLYVSEYNTGEVLAYPISGGVLSNVTPQIVVSGLSHLYQIAEHSGNYYLAEGSGPNWEEYNVGSGGSWSLVGGCSGVSAEGASAIAVDSTGSVYEALYNSPDEILKIDCLFTVTSTMTATNTATNIATSTPTNTATQTVTTTATNSATNTPLITSTFTSTATNTNTATPSATFTITPTPTITSTFTITATSTPVSVTPTPTPVPGGCVGSPIDGYTYPNPASGGTMNLSCNLCESSTVVVTVYNVAGEKTGTYNYLGVSGTNVFAVNISGFSYGIYFLKMQSTGPSGSRQSVIKKFAITR